MNFTRVNAWRHLWDFLPVLGGKLSTVGVVFIGGILMARFGGPAEYGMFSVAISAILLCDGVIGAPLDTAAVRFTAMHPGEPERTRRFEAMAMQLKGLAAIMLLLGALGLRPVFGQWQSAMASSSFPFFSCLFATACLLLARSTATGLQIRLRFKAYSILDLAQGTARLLGFGLFTILHQAKAGIYVLMYGAVACVAAVWGWLGLGQSYLLGGWPARADISRMLRYCGCSAAIFAFGTFTGRGDLLILAGTRGAANVADYGLASQIAMLVGQVAFYVSILTQPRVLRLAQQGRLRHLLVANFVLVALTGIVAAVVLRPGVLEWGTELVFGKGFEQSGPLLKVLLIGAFLDLLIVPVLMVFCLQTCPVPVLVGEVIIALGFLAAAAAAATGRMPWPSEAAMAWVANGARLAKLLLYGGLFLAHTSPAAIAALPGVKPKLPDESTDGSAREVLLS